MAGRIWKTRRLAEEQRCFIKKRALLRSSLLETVKDLERHECQFAAYIRRMQRLPGIGSWKLRLLSHVEARVLHCSSGCKADFKGRMRLRKRKRINLAVGQEKR